MDAIVIRPARREDAGMLNSALRRLSESMGDPHHATDAMLVAAGFGDDRAFRALLAEQAGRLVGVAVFSPLFSTVRGMAGAYVSDLWVDDEVRGQQLGQRLLAAVRDEAARFWGAGFLRLGVYRDNPRAQAFYDRLGFVHNPDEIYLTLTGADLAALKGLS